MNKYILSLILILGFVGVIYSINQKNYLNFSGISSVSSQSCTVTESVATVGHQLSSTLLSANSRRAWAIIAQPLNATNTVALSFNAGAAATLNSPLYLENASTTNGNYDIRFGLATDFPYTGAVTGITPSASSTVRVIQCVF